jgi:hypothetical protein
MTGSKRSGHATASRLATRPLFGYHPPMTKRSASFSVRPSAFAGETVRALFSTLLLLGLSGDRRAR